MSVDRPPSVPDCARLLNAIGQSDRLRIVYHLREGPRFVGELAGLLGLSIVNTSHHLGILRRVGLVQNQRQGRSVQYRLNPLVYQPAPAGRKVDYLDLGCCRLELPR